MKAAAAFIACLFAVSGSGCGKGDAPSPQGNAVGARAAEAPAPVASGGGEAAVPPMRDFSVNVTPLTPSRIAPPSISVRSPGGRGAEVLSVQWYVNGIVEGNDPTLAPSRFRRGDRIRATVKLRGNGTERSLSAPEVLVANSPPVVTDVRLDPAAPITGSVIRVVDQEQDADGDPVKCRYGWHVDGVDVKGDGESFSLAGVKKGSWVHVTATPSDGIGEGAWRDSARHQVVNAPPVVKNSPPVSLPPSRLFRHTIVAEDPDGDPLTFALSSAPAGVGLSGSTLVWEVPEDTIGKPVTIVVTISDGDGGQTVQTYSMTIRGN
ncbi:MAG: hypothetical protein C4529_02545 [Deltaproteobacteria bacterium]|nr:MAG: hypothetical protein C4529_02545 [Deltaproteobacteria bacterium]